MDLDLILNTYYFVSIISIIFNIILSVITYRHKKEIEVDKKDVEKIAAEIKQSVDSDKNDRRNIELITNLLSNLMEIQKSLRSLRNSDDKLSISGTSVMEIINDIYEKFLEIQNNEYIFKNNNHYPRIEEFRTLVELYEDKEKDERKISIMKLTEINTSNTSFLRKLKADLQ